MILVKKLIELQTCVFEGEYSYAVPTQQGSRQNGRLSRG
jgi:hypothetical protein